MGIRDWFFKQRSGRGGTAAGPAPSAAKSGVQYFEVPVTATDRFLCSDNECPCPGTEPLVPGKTGFLFISSAVVEMRKDARSQAEIKAKLERIRQTLHGADSKSAIVWDVGTTRPIFVCRQGAERLRLNLATAAQDAKMWVETSRCPLRPTPKV